MLKNDLQEALWEGTTHVVDDLARVHNDSWGFALPCADAELPFDVFILAAEDDVIAPPDGARALELALPSASVTSEFVRRGGGGHAHLLFSRWPDVLTRLAAVQLR